MPSRDMGTAIIYPTRLRAGIQVVSAGWYARIKKVPAQFKMGNLYAERGLLEGYVLRNLFSG